MTHKEPSTFTRARHLGAVSEFPVGYDASLLEGIPRSLGREGIGIRGAAPFGGEDLWNCYELTWLDEQGRPQVGLLRLIVPADSVSLVESKSLKLYLSGYTFHRVESRDALESSIHADLRRVLGTDHHTVRVYSLEELGTLSKPSLETSAKGYSSELLRSLCPVTGQPDYGTLLVRAEGGEAIDPRELDDLVLEHRNFQGFHEQCCEIFFLAIESRWKPASLAVGCFYTRRGGIDINPIRRSRKSAPELLRYFRTVRQ